MVYAILTIVILVLSESFMKLNFFSDVFRKNVWLQDWKLLLQKIEELVGKRPGILNVILTNNERIRQMNGRFRFMDHATDVLSFPYHPFGELVGEVYISLEKAQEQAFQKRRTLRSEMNTLFIHGVLHVLGYDHEENSDYRVMKLFEKKVLHSLLTKQKGSTKK